MSLADRPAHRGSALRALRHHIAVLLAISLFGCSDSPPDWASAGLPLKAACPTGESVLGIDIASHQHPNGAPIDWRLVAQEKRFAIIKATEGGGYRNPYFDQDMDGARQAGLYVGAYHYLRFTLDGIAQAQHFLEALGGEVRTGDLPPMLDVEDTRDAALPEERVQVMREFLEEVTRETGRVPLLYSGAWYWTGYLGSPRGFHAYPLVWAAYPADPQNWSGAACPRIPEDFPTLLIWQYQGTGGRTRGIVADVDQDVFYGSERELAALAHTEPRFSGLGGAGAGGAGAGGAGAGGAGAGGVNAGGAGAGGAGAGGAAVGGARPDAAGRFPESEGGAAGRPGTQGDPLPSPHAEAPAGSASWQFPEAAPPERHDAHLSGCQLALLTRARAPAGLPLAALIAALMGFNERLRRPRLRANSPAFHGAPSPSQPRRRCRSHPPG